VPGATVVALAFTALPAAPAAAASHDFRCASDNHWCIGAFVKHGHRSLDVAIFHVHGRYRVCVTPPGAGQRETCQTYTLVLNGAGAMASSVRFTKHFPHTRSGRYHVRWIVGGKQLGPTLWFAYWP